MSSLIKHLDDFNRKERFFLVGFALGNPGFRPHVAFLQELGAAVGTTFPHDPDDTWCWMDYHLDWLYASLVLTNPSLAVKPPFQSPRFRSPKPEVFWNVNTNQEDVDLLLAFDEGPTTHLVMVEAKGEMGWDSDQLRSKGRRLKSIFEENKLSAKRADVQPHFAIASPRTPTSLDGTLDKWPEDVPGFMRPKKKLQWIRLHIPPGRRKIQRCNGSGDALGAGEYWQLTGGATA